LPAEALQRGFDKGCSAVVFAIAVVLVCRG